MKKRYVTAREIDGRKGIKTPHERELEELGRNKVEIFLKNKKRRIKINVESQLRGIVENLGLDENYTVTFEFFPEVKAHILFFNYEDEDDLLGGAELKFLFSGERVMWVPTEDSISLLDATLDFLERNLQNSPEIFGLIAKKSDLLEMAIHQRKEPFQYLKEEHLNDLGAFLAATFERTGNTWEISKTFFEGFTVNIIYNKEFNRLDIGYKGENLLKLNNYVRDQFGIFLINHCLRFISITYPEIKMPKIVKQVFSYSYIKTHLNNEV